VSDLPVAAGSADATTPPSVESASHAGPAEVVTPAGRLGRLRAQPVLRPLTDRDYRIFWAGESISVLGDQFHFVALSWLVLQVTGSGLALGTVLMAAAIPRGILMVFGGAIADRVQPKALIFRSNALRALVVGVVAALVVSGRVELWQLIVMAVLFGAVDAFFYPAVNTFLPLLVPGERLAAANGLSRPRPSCWPIAPAAGTSRSSGPGSPSSSTRPASRSPLSPSRSSTAACGQHPRGCPIPPARRPRRRSRRSPRPQRP
jgi:hypothetical protein